jgi:hypothetical protein
MEYCFAVFGFNGFPPVVNVYGIDLYDKWNINGI